MALINLVLKTKEDFSALQIKGHTKLNLQLEACLLNKYG